MWFSGNGRWYTWSIVILTGPYMNDPPNRPFLENRFQDLGDLEEAISSLEMSNMLWILWMVVFKGYKTGLMRLLDVACRTNSRNRVPLVLWISGFRWPYVSGHRVPQNREARLWASEAQVSVTHNMSSSPCHWVSCLGLVELHHWGKAPSERIYKFHLPLCDWSSSGSTPSYSVQGRAHQTTNIESTCSTDMILQHKQPKIAWDCGAILPRSHSMCSAVAVLPN